MTMENVDVPQMSDLDEALLILGPMIENGASEDEMAVALIQNGIKYARAGRMLAKVLEAKGLKVSAKDRYAAAAENLTNWGFAPASWDDVEEAVENLVEELDATNAAQALSCVKRFAKEHEIALPEKPKGVSGGRARGDSVFDTFYALALRERDITDEQIKEFIASREVTEKQAAKYYGRFTGIIRFARKYAEA